MNAGQDLVAVKRPDGLYEARERRQGMCEVCAFISKPSPHEHTFPAGYLGVPVHDQGAAQLHREHAQKEFWEKMREIVREEVRAVSLPGGQAQ